MFNPLVDSFSKLSDSEVEDKIIELSRKYVQSYNPQLQMQVGTILEMYKEELRARRAKANMPTDNGENSLDNLIKIS
jgi:hypothetical protein